MAGNLTRINNNQITDAVSGNTQFGINANTKVQPYSVTSTLLANNLTYGSDLTITGNLSVTGNVTAIDTTNTTIEDPLLLLASMQTGSPTVDIGYIGQRGTSNNIAFVWQESSSQFVTVFTDSGATDNTVANVLSYANFATGNANVTGTLVAANISFTGNVAGNLSVTGTVFAGNIETPGYVSALGNIQTGNYFIGDGGYISNINAANVSSTKISNGTSQANIGTPDGNLVITINGNSTATFYDTGLNVSGDVSTVGNVYASAVGTTADVSAAGNVYGANFATTGSGGNITGANVISSTTLSATGNVYGNNLNATTDVSAGGSVYANSTISASGNIFTNSDFSATGNITSGNVYTTNLSLSGNVISTLNVTTNVNANSVNATTNLSAGGNVIAANSVNTANLSLSGNVLSTLNVTDNVNANNVNTTNNVSAIGNVYGANFATAGFVSATGNITGGNITTGGTVSVTGNVYTDYVYANNQVSAGGNVITNQSFVGNALVGNSLVIASTFDGLLFSVTGNINAGTSYITNVINPVNPQDAATKSYVDGIANGLQIKAPSNTATTGNIFDTTGYTYTYNNGTAGVGATITFDTTGNVTIDTVQLTAGMRVLIKDEPLVSAIPAGTTPSAAYNGIYEVTTAGSPSAALVLTRSTDDDTPSEMYSAYTFITSPILAVNSNSSWVSTNTPTSPGDPIVIGTTFYIFVQFSSVAKYTGGNAINITGTVISALYDGNTIAVNGSNQLHIPANALLTTPNIGDATGNSLSVIGSVIGNVFQATTLSVTGDASIGNITTGNLSLSGNVLTNLNVTADVNAGNIVSYGLLSAVGNVYGGNISSANIYDTSIGSQQLVFGNTDASGKLSSASTLTTDGNNVSAGGNISAGGFISATGNITAANFTTTGSSGNITGANIIAATTLSATGTVYGGNIVTPNTTINGGVVTTGIVSALGNIQTGNYFIGDGAYISNINAANVSSTKITNGGSYANIATPDGNLVIAIGAGSSIVANFYDQGLSLTGNVTTNATVNAYQLSLSGNVISTLNVTGDTNANNVNVTTNLSAGGNVIGANILTIGKVSATANVIGGNILTGGYVSSTGNVQSGTTMLVDTTTSSVTLGANVTQTTGATLAINATDSMLIPVGSTGDRPGTPATGMLRYNSTISQCEIWNGAAWVAVGGSSYTVITNEQFNGDGSTVDFTLGSSQTTDSCIVTINGVVQIPTTAYSVSGVYPTCVLTFTEAPQISDTIDVREITTTTSVTAISNSPGNAIVAVSETIAQVNITGNLVAQLNVSAPSLTANSTMSFQLVNNTTLAILVRGTDGVTRSTTLTLS
jgi:hypothetical protein